MTEIKPIKALSVRQPWAWAICYANKHLENRSWGSWNHHLKQFRGEIYIHASRGMTRHEYEDAHDFMARNGVACPLPNELLRGGLIGTARVVGWTRFSHSFWFVGPGALELRDIHPLFAPIPCAGSLGFFDPRPDESDLFEPAAKWMLPHTVTNDAEHDEPQVQLL